MANWIDEIRGFFGMQKDFSPTNVPANKYIDAENIRLYDKSLPFLGGATLTTGNEYKFDLGRIDAADHRKCYRIAVPLSADGLTVTITITGAPSPPYTITTGTGTPTDRYNGFVSDLATQMADISGIVYINAPDLTLSIVHCGFSFVGNYEATSATPLQLIKEYTGDVGGVFVPLKTYNAGDDLYILKSNGGVTAIDHAIKNESTGAWTNTTIFQTKQIKYPVTDINLVDFVYELDLGERCSFYYSGTPPRVTYCKQQIDTWILDYSVTAGTFVAGEKIVGTTSGAVGYINSVDLTNYVLDLVTVSGTFAASETITGKFSGATGTTIGTAGIYPQWVSMASFVYNENPAFIETGNLDGYYTFENVVAATQRQITENFAFVLNATVNNTGGGLTTGNKYYFIRQCIGSTIKTQFGLASNPVSIFSASLTNTRLYGNKGGEASAKSVTLGISGLNTLVYDSFELGYVENIDGVLTEWVLTNRFPINVATITHTGFEAKAALTPGELLVTQAVLTKTGNEVINRNRLFSSDVEVQLTPPQLKDFTTSCIAMTTVRGEIPAIGLTYSTVNEYQKPSNVYSETDYMYNETYRFGIQWKFKNGFVCEPCFAIDYKITYATPELTDAGTPTKVYTFYPQATIDLSDTVLPLPLINGEPFLDVIDGYSIVRLPCVPEVLATGYVMPAVYTNTSNYTVGGYAADGVDSYNFADTTIGGFLSPDVIFGNAEIDFIAGDVLKTSSFTGYKYNTEEKFPSNPLTKVYLHEMVGYFLPALVDKTLVSSEVVPFNSVGVKDMAGRKLSTSLTDFQTGANQKLIAVDISPSTFCATTSSLGFQYAQYYRAKANKYGANGYGNYISCGHYRQAITKATYTDNIHGGDTFTQKNITKFCNKKNFEITSVTYGATATTPYPWTSEAWAYVIQAYDGSSVLICQTPVYNQFLLPTDVSKKQIITWDSVAGADHYLVYYWNTSGINWVYNNAQVNAPLTSFTLDQPVGAFTVNNPVGSTSYNLSAGLSYYTQNRNNYQLRYFDATDNKNYPYTTTDINVWIGTGEELVEGTLKYSQSYTPTTPVQIFPAYDSTLPVDSKQPSTLYYSELKIDGSPLDPYRTVKPINFKSYSQYGRITNTFMDVNALIIMTENAVLQQRLDVQQQQTDPNGTDIILGNGTVLGSREIVSSWFGAELKSAALQYITKAGSWFVVWYNKNQKKVFRRGGDGTRCLTEQNFIQTFVSNNNQFVASENDIIMGWDAWSQEVLMEAKATIPSFSVWNSGATYNVGDIVAFANPIGIDGVTHMNSYYKAKINVPSGAGYSPNIIINQLNYWEIYRNSNYLIAFCEHDNINDYTSFYGYSCDSFMPYKDTFLTNKSVHLQTDHPNFSGIYEHNLNTLVYYGDIGTNPNTGLPIRGYISLIFNKENSIFRTIKKIWIMAQDLIITDIHLFGGNNRSQTFSIQSDIVEKRPGEGAWWSNAKNDATITGTNTTGANNTLTAKVGGQTNNAIVFFKNTDNTKIGNINRIILSCIPKPRNPFS